MKELPGKGGPLGQSLLLLASAILTVLCVGWVLYLSHYGIDLTDESFYLVSMANPFIYSVSSTQFGLVYHPLYVLLGGDIAALRQANVLITYGLSFALAYAFLLKEFDGQVLGSKEKVVLSAGLATTALATSVFAGLWLPTPSCVAGWILIAVGGWLTFLAKPTSAAVLMLCAGVYLIAARKFSFRWVAVSAGLAVGLTISFGILIDGSLTAFIARLEGGVNVGKTLEGGHTVWNILRVDSFHLGSKVKTLLINSTLIFFVAAFLVKSKNNGLRWGGWALSIGFVAAACLLMFDGWPDVLGYGHFHGLLLWSIPYAAVILLAAMHGSQGIGVVLRERWPFALTFLILPYAYAIGTSNNYWILSSQAGIFWVLVGLVFLRPLHQDKQIASSFLVLCLAVQLIVVAVVQAAVERPYRQPQPLRQQIYPLAIGGVNSQLFVPEGFGRYLTSIGELAKRAGFQAGTPMIDLSGVSPGVPYFLGAMSVGQAWVIGGYPGSNRLAMEMQKMAACRDLAAAWLLVEPNGVARISPEILLKFGANLATDYTMVGA
ncbi:MAG: hypothetical protein K2W93_10615, partial [Burkholderiaceae bacterium]|nr:hypothetical protein [Burkholderiaceae bacterium]